jgi:CubicO group peptidase (beta-lactamase class C family)
MTLLLLLAGMTGSAVQPAPGGPPPEIRALVDSVVRALNGDADTWEAFAQARFTPALLARQSSEERRRMHGQLVADLGRITIERVTRQGPEAPLELHVAGERERGVIELTVEGEPAAPRVAGLRVRLGAGPPRGADPPGVPPPPLDGSLAPAEIEKRLDAYISRLANDGTFSGVALAARDGQPVFLRAYGLADRERQVANTTATRFNIGSITKVFTQIAVRQLVRAGRLALTDSLGSYFPDYPQAASRTATVEQLLAHRGGLADFFGPEFDRVPKTQFASNADYFAFVSRLPPRFAPGERTEYCNGCYIALGAIVEKVTGIPYERYVAERVFAPAGMTQTGSPRTDRPEPDMAIGYTRLGPSGELRRNLDMHGVAGSAAGGSYSTASDLLAFVRAVRAGTFPDTPGDLAVAGGAPGVSAVIEVRGRWTVIVLTNLDPPVGERLGTTLADALAR